MNIHFFILRQPIELPILVVESLGQEEIVLGRDFFLKYDVILDLPYRRMTMANAAGHYRLKPTYVEIETESQKRGTIAQQTTIPAGRISMIQCKVHSHPRGRGTTPPIRTDNWLALVDGERDQSLQVKGVVSPYCTGPGSGRQNPSPFSECEGRGGK